MGERKTTGSLKITKLFISSSIIINGERYTYKNGFILGVEVLNTGDTGVTGVTGVKIPTRYSGVKGTALLKSRETGYIRTDDLIEYLYSDNCEIISPDVYKEHVYNLEYTDDGNLIFKKCDSLQSTGIKTIKSDDFIYMKFENIKNLKEADIFMYFGINEDYIRKIRAKEINKKRSWMKWRK